MKAVVNFFREVIDCARTGRRKYFLHNLSCRYDWIWAIRYCLIRDGRLRDTA